MMESALTKLERTVVITSRFKNFKDIPYGSYQQSRRHSDLDVTDAEWSIRLYPNGCEFTEHYRNPSEIATLQILYHGKQKVTARFITEIIRNEQEYKNEVEPLIKRESTRFCFSGSDMKSLTLSNFLSHKVLYNRDLKLLPSKVLILRVKVFFFFDSEAQHAAKLSVNQIPPKCNTFVTLVLGNEELKNVPALPLRKASKLFYDQLADPKVTHLHFDYLDPVMCKICLAFIFNKSSFFDYIKKNPHDKKILKYAEKLKIDDLVMLLTRSDVTFANRKKNFPFKN